MQQKVRWELKLTDRQKVDEYVKYMEKCNYAHPCPTEASTIDAVQEYTRILKRHVARKGKQPYQRAEQDERRSSHKVRWSPVFIGYKAHLTALVII